ncbi:uncharacterized protein LOC142230915 [Haematobia irritans]|uniref:uncharacterized protein LOC142230915 n=1 Tax=Haematobia irritans TaxID=7368 RepID=UPI003F4F9146
MGNESVEILNGIPQGSCLSPTLFNLYTLALHGFADDKTHIFQFADDFIILCHDKEFDIATKLLQIKIIQFASMLNTLNLKINSEKTGVMYVAKGPTKIPLISLNGTLIKPVNSIRFLGRSIKNSLSLKEHYDDVISSCQCSLNAVKLLTCLKSGFHPSTAINIAKSVIFSTIEYSRSSMAHMPSHQIKKITSFQYQILRRTLGLTSDTPIHVVYAFAGVLPPSQRAHLLAAKELISLKTHNRIMYHNISESATSKTSLGMVYLKFKHIFDNLVINDLVSASPKLEININLFQGDKHSINSFCFKSVFLQKVSELQSEGYSIWATDASFQEETTGCAVCNISSNHNFLFTIRDKVSSHTGELHAIDKTIDLIIEDGFSKAAIFSDSKNACLLLIANSANNYMINNIQLKINNSKIQNISIIWTPSHIGIEPNERADFFAKHAALVGCEIHSSFSIRDAQQRIQSELWKEWCEDYKIKSTTKGKYFAKLFPEPPKI